MSVSSVTMLTEEQAEINPESETIKEPRSQISIVSEVSIVSTNSEFSRTSEITSMISMPEIEQPGVEEVKEQMEEKISTEGEAPTEVEAPPQVEDEPKTETISQTQEEPVEAEQPPALPPKQSADAYLRSSSVAISGYTQDDDDDDTTSLAKSISQLMSKAKVEGDEVVGGHSSFDTTFSLIMDDEVAEYDDETSYIYVEETVMDDLGKEVKFQQKVPILRETRKYELLSDTAEEGEEKKINVFLEHITRIIKKSELNAEGETEEVEQEITEIKEIERPPPGVEIFSKRLNERGEEIEVILSPDEYEEKKSYAKSISDVGVPHVGRHRKERYVPKHIKKIKVMKLMQSREVEPCTQGKVRDVIKPVMEEEIEEESEIEDYLLVDEEELSEEELAELHEEIQRKKEEKMKKLEDSLRTVLVRIALAEKKRNLYMQLISISAEVKEDILNPPDPDKPSFKVPKKTKTEDKFRKMYLEKLMEYRELRSVILVKLAMEKKRKEEVKKKYDVIAAEVDQLRKSLEEKLHGAIPKLLPKHDPVFNNQSPQAMVKRVLNLVERLDHETKELMYKKKQMYLAKQKYDEVTENEQGLGYKFAVASKDLLVLGSKNDRRNEKLEALKATTQRESLAITHITQKCDVIMKTTDEKNEKLEFLNRSLNRARQDRKDVHCARRKVEAELRSERAKTKLKNHPGLIREYNLVEELFKAKQIEYQQLRRECGPSIDHYKQFTSNENQH